MQPLPLMDTVLHWWVLLALVLVGGGFAYTPLVARASALADYRRLAASRTRRLLWAAILFAGVAIVLAAVYSLASVSRHAGIYGAILAVRIALLGLLAVMLALRREASAWALLPTAVLLLTQSLLSHSAAEPQPIAPVLADWAHLTFTSLWLGGVAMFGLVSVPLVGPKDLGLLIARFSPLAMFCVLAVTFTGIVQSAGFLGSVDAMFTTSYGRVILAKIVLLLVLIGFGAFHQQVISPRLQAWRLRDVAGAQQAMRRFRASIMAELAVSVMILLAAGALTALSPVMGG